MSELVQMRLTAASAWRTPREHGVEWGSSISVRAVSYVVGEKGGKASSSHPG